LKYYHSYSEIRSDLELGKASCVQLVDYHLQNISQKDGCVNAFLEVFSEEARKNAVSIDKKIKHGNAGRLAGMVIGIKDLFCLKRHKISCSSKILEGFESQITATSIQRLIDEDAIIIGRQNCDEFAMGSSSENSAYAATRNPLDLDRVPGGSSGGSAAAVAADMCQVSIGSDTGGSIRQPAAFCGIVGLKPTYSRVSRYGLTAYASSFDCPGVLSKSIEDSELVLEIMSGHDPKDSTSSRTEFNSANNDTPERPRRIAYIKELMDEQGCNKDVKNVYANFIETLRSKGHTIHEVSFPYVDYLLPIYYILTSAEASANLSRYDGVRYGQRAAGVTTPESLYKKSRTQFFGAEVLRRIMLGTFVLSASYHDAFYTKAQRARKLVRDFTNGILAEHDFIVMPTAPSVAFKIGEKTKDPLAMYLSDIFTVQASVSGLPAISIPFGHGVAEMPIGMQIMGPAFEESSLCKFSNTLLKS
jgi:aspartyl-tRNA(Asn)/glutamyl-tRNA(Gln) amidotransferase subunit A